MDKLKKFEFFYKGTKVKLLRDLDMKDGLGTRWVQIEILEGAEKGRRLPAIMSELTR